ncbi:MAG: hypothetical protein ACOC2C_05940, partial [Cyclonatronaceae bacterium]
MMMRPIRLALLLCLWAGFFASSPDAVALPFSAPVQGDAALAPTDSAAYADTMRVTLGEVYIEAARLPIKWREQPV